MTLAMQQESGLLQIVQRALVIYGGNVVPLLVISAIGLTVNIPSWIWNEQWLSMLMLLPSYVVGAIVHGALVQATHRGYSGSGSVSIGASVSAAWHKAWQLTTTTVLSGVLALLSLVGLPYFTVRWWFAPQSVVLEDTVNWSALDRSRAAVRGRWWRVALTLLAIHIVPAVWFLASTVSLFGGSPIDHEVHVAVTLVIAALAPAMVAADTILYLSLRSTSRVA